MHESGEWHLNSTVVTTEVDTRDPAEVASMYLNSTVVTTEVSADEARALQKTYLNSTVVTTEAQPKDGGGNFEQLFKFYCSNN